MKVEYKRGYEKKCKRAYERKMEESLCLCLCLFWGVYKITAFSAEQCPVKNSS